MNKGKCLRAIMMLLVLVSACLLLSGWIPGTTDHRPGLREGINLTFRIEARPQGFSIVEIGASIPLAIPGVFLDILL